MFPVKSKFLSKKRLNLIHDDDFMSKKYSNYKNNVTFSNKTFLGQVLKVTLFCRFSDIPMLFELSEISNFVPTRELEIKTKWGGTKFEGVFWVISTYGSISMRI